jgi:hypothetical protein
MGAGALAPGRVCTEFPKDKEFRAFEMLEKIGFSLKPGRCDGLAQAMAGGQVITCKKSADITESNILQAHLKADHRVAADAMQGAAWAATVFQRVVCPTGKDDKAPSPAGAIQITYAQAMEMQALNYLVVHQAARVHDNYYLVTLWSARVQLTTKQTS